MTMKFLKSGTALVLLALGAAANPVDALAGGSNSVLNAGGPTVSTIGSATLGAGAGKSAINPQPLPPKGVPSSVNPADPITIHHAGRTK